MKPDRADNQWREITWRRPLNAGEEAEFRAWLAAHPEAQAEWEAETQLSAALAQLPSAPVPSNFTARVLQSVECESRRELQSPTSRRMRWWRGFLPRVAVAVAVLGLGLFAYHRHQTARQVERTLQLVEILPDPKALEDFEAISRLSFATVADEELLALNEELLALMQ
ncbi:MAG: hypothetical protein IH623_30090 [Verrucomicrobia bacterium]|nr:hypothetical protein [Verrucomicrobiota bacterium]